MIRKHAAIIIADKRLLVVRKKGTRVYISPGGKPEKGESPLECLNREMLEELGVRPRDYKHFGDFSRKSEFEDKTVYITAWFATVTEDCVPSSEIEEIAWVNGRDIADGFPIGSVFAECVMPRLISEGLIDA